MKLVELFVKRKGGGQSKYVRRSELRLLFFLVVPTSNNRCRWTLLTNSTTSTTTYEGDGGAPADPKNNSLFTIYLVPVHVEALTCTCTSTSIVTVHQTRHLHLN